MAWILRKSKKPNGTKYSEKMFRTEYMKKFVKEGKSELTCGCSYFDREMQTESICGHMDSKNHTKRLLRKKKKTLKLLLMPLQTIQERRKRKVVEIPKEVQRTTLKIVLVLSGSQFLRDFPSIKSKSLVCLFKKWLSKKR